jgi:hypothetical protein
MQMMWLKIDVGLPRVLGRRLATLELEAVVDTGRRGNGQVRGS